MASEVDVKLSIKYHWWVSPYLHACRLFSQITGMQPDTDKIAERIVRYGVTITVEGKK